MLLTLITAACFYTVMQCYEKGVAQSGQQLKAVSPVKSAAQFSRQRSGAERLPAKEWIEAMPVETLRWTAMNILIELGFPQAVQTAAAIQSRTEKAS